MSKTELINHLNNNLCLFIKETYFTPFKINNKEVSMNEYAKACKLTKSTISKINSTEGYSIPVSTIYLIIKFEGDNLEDFFKGFTEYLKKKQAEEL